MAERDGSPVQEGPRAGVRGWVSTGQLAAGGLAVAWLVCLGRILRHRIFVTHDTLIDYAHVWYISGRLWHCHGLPFRMPVLGHGRALTYPYAFVPWTAAAILRPLVGDWIVTLWLVLGAVLVIVATYWAFPEVRRGWWAAAVLVNPALVAAPLLGQLPFLWASAFLLAAIGSWRRERRWWATVFMALGQMTHPAVVAPMAVAVVAAWWRWEPDRRAFLRHYAFSLLPVVPAAAMVWMSPVFTESSTWVKLVGFVETVTPRSLIVFVPIGLALAYRRRPRDTTAILACVLLVIGIGVYWQPQRLPTAWIGQWREPDQGMRPFLTSRQFVADRTYRLLRIGDENVAEYQLLRAGGRLDAEFFPESILDVSFPSALAYSRVLRSREVDAVMIWQNYVRVAKTNEKALLDTMARRPPARCDGPSVCVSVVAATRRYSVYRIQRDGVFQARPAIT